MRRRLFGAFLPLALMCAGCATKGKFVPPVTPLDRAISLVESDDRGNEHGLTAPDSASDSIVTRRPNPVAVDIQSTIRVRVLKKQLLTGAGGDSTRVDSLRAREERLTRMLGALAEFLEKRRLALDAYVAAGTDPSAEGPFFQRADAMAATEESLIEVIREEWPDTTDAIDSPRAHIESLVETWTKDAKFKEFLQAELDQTNAEYRELAGSVTFKLRLEAFLQSPGKGPIPIHLEGYDNLQEGNLERRDRLGLSLEGAERERFDSLVAQSKQLAATAERVRTGEASLEDAFKEVSVTVLGKVREVAIEVIELSPELKLDALRDRFDRTERAFFAFVALLETRLRNRADAAIEVLKQDAGEELEDLKNGPLGALAGLPEIVNSLQSNLGTNFRPEALPAILGNIFSLRPLLEEGLDLAISDDIVNPIRERFLAKLADLPQDVRDSVRADYRASGAETVLAEWSGLAIRLEAVVERVSDLVNTLSIAPLPGNIEVPEAFEVAVSDAPDTFIDLERTPRLDGDRVVLRARVLDGDEEVYPPSHTSFDVRYLGWHARLDPSVVLVRPDKLPSEGESFRFAPVISWLHQYHPRPDDTGPLAGFWRATGLGAGIHAAFVDFDPVNSVEIGLGITIGLWDGILQGGLGWNLMVEKDDTGRQYFFVGSSLISLLQRLGQN